MVEPSLRDRAKGPLRNADDYRCPWCGAECFDPIEKCVAQTDNMQPQTVGICTSCNCEFVCQVSGARFVVIGLRSQADVKYQVHRQALQGAL